MKKTLSTLMIAVLAIFAAGLNTAPAIADDNAYLVAKTNAIDAFAATTTNAYAGQVNPPCATVTLYTDNSTVDTAMDQEDGRRPQLWTVYDSNGKPVDEKQYETPEAIATAPDGLFFKWLAIRESDKKKADAKATS